MRLFALLFLPVLVSYATACKWVVDSWHPDPAGQPFEGFEWRTVKKLQINYLWTYLYITKAPAGHVSRVWFDHIVAARKYIGPIATGRKKSQLKKKKTDESTPATAADR